MEKWKMVPILPEYEVSTHGRLRRLVDASRMYKKGYMPNPPPNKDGYWYAEVNRKMYAVHRLVLITFVGPPPKGHECHHKDGVRSNNHLSNLKWVSHSENIKHWRSKKY